MMVIRDVSGDGESGFIAFKRPQLGCKVRRQLECAPEIRVDGGSIIHAQSLLQRAFNDRPERLPLIVMVQQGQPIREERKDCKKTNQTGKTAVNEEYSGE